MKYTSALLYLITSPLFASIAPGQWQCLAFDTKEQSYQGQGIGMQQAMQAALSRCQQTSKQGACKTAQSFCEQGPLSVIDSRCMVSDESGRTWDTNGEDACKTGMSLCNEWQYELGNTRSQCSVKHQMD